MLNPNMPLSFHTSTSTSLASSALHSDIPQHTEGICCPLQVTKTTAAYTLLFNQAKPPLNDCGNSTKKKKNEKKNPTPISMFPI